MKYQVIDPAGIVLSGKTLAQGTLLPETKTTSAQVRAFLRFKQIEAVKERAEPKDREGNDEPTDPPSTVAGLKEALQKLGITFPEDARKADLEKLYAETQAPQT